MAFRLFRLELLIREIRRFIRDVMFWNRQKEVLGEIKIAKEMLDLAEKKANLAKKLKIDIKDIDSLTNSSRGGNNELLKLPLPDNNSTEDHSKSKEDPT